MVWFRVDDNFPFHPKTVAAGNAAIGVWTRAAAWASRELTDGHVPFTMLSAFGADRRISDRLVKAGFWVPDSDSWTYHDWFDYNPSRHDVLLAREARAESGGRGAHTRWHTRRKIVDPECPYCREDHPNA